NWNHQTAVNWNLSDCGLQPDNVQFGNGIMSLTLDNIGCPQACDGKPYASAEYRTTQEVFSYGLYETRMRAAEGFGLVSSFFVYTGTYGQPSHHEIDFEVLGKDCSMVQTNYYVEGRGHHEQMIPLGFDACQEFHNYGFAWQTDSLVFYIDGKEVRRITENSATPAREIPFKPGKIMVNLWPGIGVDSWLGSFTYQGHSISAQYDWIRYLSQGTETAPLSMAQTPQTATATPATPSSTPVNSLSIADIQTGSFAFNGGSARVSGSTYTFSATQTRDPGFGISTGNRNLEGRNILKFEIKGDFTQHGNYARLIVQVYAAKDSDSSPSVSLDPIRLDSNWTEISVDLQGRISTAKKVQFLLVTDNGSCNVEIANLRFE
ncbi:MAG: family 16 glycosylhydrolase, partial [Candidatus Margulisbacteria bacterium]|nr:family 16 glycosylhydrolase [Candidatus Margulisiibacteriota bacterium]